MTLPTLRRELIAAFVLVFTGAFVVATTGVLLLLPRFTSPLEATIYLAFLLLLDVGVFAIFGHVLITKRVLEPIHGIVVAAESIANGETETVLPEAETRELAQLSESLNDMARRLIADQDEMAANIRSLDETNRQLTEARDAMVHTEKLASAGRLGAGIAHEVGNPLSAIIGYLGLLEKSATGRDAELVTAAEQEARRIDRIVRGLLDYARPRDARTLTLDVNQIINETVELVSTQGKFRNIKLELSLEDELPPVLGDSYQMQQVLVNLMVNAADALEKQKMPEPVVSVESRRRLSQAAPPLLARRKDDHPRVDYTHRRRLHAAPRALLPDPGKIGSDVVEIIVSDNGPGIPRDLIDQIFEPFVTTKDVGEGTGLGLAVCARLIEGMGGVIRADSGETGGAAFHIVLPATAEAPPASS